MHVPLKEFEVKVLSPNTLNRCEYNRCKDDGNFALTAKSDRDIYIFHYRNICEKHIIYAFIDALTEKD